jgi:hypothetical protein
MSESGVAMSGPRRPRRLPARRVRNGAVGAAALLLAAGLTVPCPPLSATTVSRLAPPGADTVQGRVAVEIGDPDGDRNVRFLDLTSLAMGPDGRLYVADARWSEVRAFDPDGGYAFTVDPRGTGPRVFDEPRGIFFDDEGRLWVESRHSRDVLTLDGSRTLDRQRFHRFDMGDDAPWPVAIAARPAGDRALVRAGYPRAPGGATPTLHLLSVSRSGEVDPLHPLPALPRLAQETMVATNPTRNPGARWELPHPLSGTYLWATGPDGEVAGANTNRYEILRVGADGSRLPTLEGPAIDRVPVTQADRETWLAQLERHGVILEGARFPDVHPPVRGIAFDELGRLWVELTRPADSADRVAHVFGPGGELLHVARWPADVALLPAGRSVLRSDRAWGVRLLPGGASQVVGIDWEH